jgi:hypothetical protein
MKRVTTCATRTRRALPTSPPARGRGGASRTALRREEEEAGDRGREVCQRRRDRGAGDAEARDQHEVEHDRCHDTGADACRCLARDAVPVQVRDGDRRDTLTGEPDEQNARGHHRGRELRPVHDGNDQNRERRDRQRGQRHEHARGAHLRARVRRRRLPAATRETRVRDPQQRVRRQPQQLSVLRRHGVDAERRGPRHQVHDREVEPQVDEQHHAPHLASHPEAPDPAGQGEVGALAPAQEPVAEQPGASGQGGDDVGAEQRQDDEQPATQPRRPECAEDREEAQLLEDDDEVAPGQVVVALAEGLEPRHEHLGQDEHRGECRETDAQLRQERAAEQRRHRHPSRRPRDPARDQQRQQRGAQAAVTAVRAGEVVRGGERQPSRGEEAGDRRQDAQECERADPHRARGAGHDERGDGHRHERDDARAEVEQHLPGGVPPRETASDRRDGHRGRALPQMPTAARIASSVQT